MIGLFRSPLSLLDLSALFNGHTKILHQEAVDIGLLLDDLGRRFTGAVAGFGFDTDQHRGRHPPVLPAGQPCT